MANLQIRIDDKLKEEADAIYKKLGIKLPDAIRMFLQQSVNDAGLPFRPRLPYNQADLNKKSIEAINEPLNKDEIQSFKQFKSSLINL
ncbi:MAG: type II toxin-antitoxin system RelB/DinJ family antitoxin [Alphaproteobacteria bacterium]